MEFGGVPASHGPKEERLDALLFTTTGGGVPAVDVSLGALAQFPSVSLEVGQEQPGLTKVFSGRLVTVVPDRPDRPGGPQLPQHMPGSEALQDLAVVGVLAKALCFQDFRT